MGGGSRGASLPRKAIKAFQGAGATEEMVAAACLPFASLPREAPGRPRKYKNRKEATHAYYMRHRDRLRKMEAIRRKKKARKAPREAPPVSLQQRLEEACQGNYDARVSVEPIEALLAQGCDLEADILPTVAGTVPELPRPLRSWGAKWLVQAILEARDQRLHPVLKDVAALVDEVETPLARDRRLFPTLVLRRPLADEDYDANGVSPEDAVLNILAGFLALLPPLAVRAVTLRPIFVLARPAHWPTGA
jgi:hypothetical protein